MNHILSINCLLWPKAPGVQRYSYEAVYSNGLDAISQEAVKGQSSL